MHNLVMKAARATILKFRAIDQNPVFEFALIASLLAHNYANTVRYSYRYAKSKKEGGGKLHVVSAE